MDNSAVELREKIRQQFDTGPYPRLPLERSPKNEANLLYYHNLVNPYYLRNQKVLETKGKLILDAGCGSGYKSLILASANPDAKIVGVDISEKSVELARQRLHYHGFDNTEFHVISIENLADLGLEFDYINCDEVIYLFPDPSVALQAMKSVLKLDGMLRANLHSSLQRVYYYRAQEIYKMMGLMDENPEELEIELVREFMESLKDKVELKTITWDSKFETDEERLLMNHLFQGDKGYTITEMFSALRTAELDFISMVNWRQWNLMDLFKEQEVENLPVFLAMSLPETTVEERLHLFELLNPVHRLLDFWCGHPNQERAFVPIVEWTLSDWQEAQVHLQPQLRTPELKEELVRCITQLKPFEISQQLRFTDNAVSVDSTVAACLLPLWEESQSMESLVERWQKLKPVDPVTLEPIAEGEALDFLRQALTGLERLSYVLLERRPGMP